jgi:uncharacterized protein (DUF1697 family)
MSSHVALLRAVNLGPHNKVAMVDLCRVFADAGMRDARSLLQTGNVLFTSAVSSAVKLERALEAKSDPAHLVLVALKDAPGPDAALALQRAVKGRETTRVVGREAFIVYPDGIGGSKLTMVAIERALGTRGTGRNWNTVQKIAALMA